MKFRHKKIKKEHSIIDGVLDWLEDLGKLREVTDIIPGVIDVTHSKERGVFYQYDTPTGCKLLAKNGGSIQEIFVVTPNTQVVKTWVVKILTELELFNSHLDNKLPEKDEPGNQNKVKVSKPQPRSAKKSNNRDQERSLNPLVEREGLLAGIKEDYQLVEINQGLRDALVDSLASMADTDDPKVEDIVDPAMREALRKHFRKL